MSAEMLLQQSTVAGKVDGIIGWEPAVLQCRSCGVTATQDRPSIGAFIILSGFHFHRCEGREGKRLCPDCLAAVKTECPGGACRRWR